MVTCFLNPAVMQDSEYAGRNGDAGYRWKHRCRSGCGDCNPGPMPDSDSHATLRLCSDVQLAYQREERAISLEECVRESREAVNERVPVAMVGFFEVFPCSSGELP
jgi:hypothetical protein